MVNPLADAACPKGILRRVRMSDASDVILWRTLVERDSRSPHAQFSGSRETAPALLVDESAAPPENACAVRSQIDSSVRLARSLPAVAVHVA